MKITKSIIEKVIGDYSALIERGDIADLKENLSSIIDGSNPNSWEEAKIDDLFTLGLDLGLDRRDIGNIFEKYDIEPAALHSSTQVSSSFIREGNTIKYKTVGRAPTVIEGSGQGDHSTAEALIEHGVGRPVDGLNVAAMDDIDELRQKRAKLYDFISAIGILQPDSDKRSQYYQAICEKLDHYNEHRQSKSELEALGDILKAINPTTLTEAKNAVLNKEDTRDSLLSRKKELIEKHESALGIFQNMVEGRYRENARLMSQLFTDVTSAVLTYYNKIPLTSFKQISGYEASSGEGASVSSATSRLEDLSRVISGEKSLRDFLGEEEKRIKGRLARANGKAEGRIKKSREETEQDVRSQTIFYRDHLQSFQGFVQENERFINNFSYQEKRPKAFEHRLSPVLEQRDFEPLKRYVFDYVVGAIKDDLYYPAILGNTPQETKKILDQHRKEANPKGDKPHIVRNNSIEDLETVISRQLFLTFEIFEELKVDERNIASAFIDKVKNQSVASHSWCEVAGIDDITTDTVLARVDEFRAEKESQHFTKYVGARTRASSGQSEEMGGVEQESKAEGKIKSDLTAAANILSLLKQKTR